jgi:hypothetical protein
MSASETEYPDSPDIDDGPDYAAIETDAGDSIDPVPAPVTYEERRSRYFRVMGGK